MELFADPKVLQRIIPGVLDHEVGTQYRTRTITKCNSGDWLCSPAGLGGLTLEQAATQAAHCLIRDALPCAVQQHLTQA
ncbi:hypothetical protein [Kitasatospora sp. NPDC085879]|uniref:hypothetical protein n=1 Tax=Kitasatospora sp. NPDC085879 TaxID=3154769 RepID=UPI00341A4484